MPRCVLELLWDTIVAGNEIFAFVKTMATNGDYRWVFGHVTPSFGKAGRKAGRIAGHDSDRRCPKAEAIAKIEPIYWRHLDEGVRHASRQTAAAGIGRSIGNIGEISANVRQTAQGTREVSEDVAQITGSSEKTGATAEGALTSAGNLSAQAGAQMGEVDRFLERFRAA